MSAGRIRTIKPEILDDERAAALSDRAWRVFVSAFVMADDYGSLRGNVDFIHGQSLWRSGASIDDAGSAVAELIAAGMFKPYSVRGQTYLHIVNWHRHQKVDRPGQRRMPGPHEDDFSIEHSRDPSREHSRENDATNRNQTREGTREGTRDLPPTVDHRPSTIDHRPKGEGSRRQRRSPRQIGPFPDGWTIPEGTSIPEGVDARREADAFRDHALANDRRCKDWNAAWRSWLRKAVEFANERRARSTPRANANPPGVGRFEPAAGIDYSRTPWGTKVAPTTAPRMPWEPDDE